MSQLPRTEDLPRSDDGFDPDRVEEAFTEFGGRVRELEEIAAELRAELRALRESRPQTYGDEDWPDEVYEGPPADWVAAIPPPFDRASAVPRIAAETAFLLVVALLAGLADLSPAWIVLVMATAWVLVAASEWAAAAKRARWRLEEVPASAAEAEASESTGPWAMPVVEATVIEPADGSDAHTAIASAVAPAGVERAPEVVVVDAAEQDEGFAEERQDPAADGHEPALREVRVAPDAIEAEAPAAVVPVPPDEEPAAVVAAPQEEKHAQLEHGPSLPPETTDEIAEASGLEAAPELPEDDLPAPPEEVAALPELPEDDAPVAEDTALELPAAEPAVGDPDETTDEDVLSAGAPDGLTDAATGGVAEAEAEAELVAEPRQRWGFFRRRKRQAAEPLEPAESEVEVVATEASEADADAVPADADSEPSEEPFEPEAAAEPTHAEAVEVEAGAVDADPEPLVEPDAPARDGDAEATEEEATADAAARDPHREAEGNADTQA